MPAHAWCFQGLVIPTLGASANHKSRVCKRRAWASSTFGIHRAKQGRSVLPKAASMGAESECHCRERRAPWGQGEGHGSPYTCADFPKDSVRERWGVGGAQPTGAHTWLWPNSPVFRKSTASGDSSWVCLTNPNLSVCQKQKTIHCYSSASLSAVAREPDRFQLSLKFPPPKPLPMAAGAPAAPQQGRCPAPCSLLPGKPSACSRRPFLSEERCSHADCTAG